MATSLYDLPGIPDLRDAPEAVRQRVDRISAAAGGDLARQADAWEYLAQYGGDVATRYWASRVTCALALALG